MIDSNKTARVRQLNDALRRSHTGGQITITAGVAALDECCQRRTVAALAAFDAFDADNDPYGEHDFQPVLFLERSTGAGSGASAYLAATTRSVDGSRPARSA